MNSVVYTHQWKEKVNIAFISHTVDIRLDGGEGDDDDSQFKK